MDYTQIFEISNTGLNLQRLRLDTIAANLANANTTKTATGAVFKPLEVVASGGSNTVAFDTVYKNVTGAEYLQGVQNVEIQERNVAPRLVFDPGHPDADEKGFVSLPNVNPVDEMTKLITATRAYEANVRVMNAAKTMALRALEIARG